MAAALLLLLLGAAAVAPRLSLLSSLSSVSARPKYKFWPLLLSYKVAATAPAAALLAAAVSAAAWPLLLYLCLGGRLLLLACALSSLLGGVAMERWLGCRSEILVQQEAGVREVVLESSVMDLSEHHHVLPLVGRAKDALARERSWWLTVGVLPVNVQCSAMHFLVKVRLAYVASLNGAAP